MKEEKGAEGCQTRGRATSLGMSARCVVNAEACHIISAYNPRRPDSSRATCRRTRERKKRVCVCVCVWDKTCNERS